MSSHLAITLFCFHICLLQSIYGQCQQSINLANNYQGNIIPSSIGYNNALGAYNSNGQNVYENLAYSSVQGGTTGRGVGEISCAGELPVGGTTSLQGNLPVIGYVTFEGNIPAGGLVSLLNNCNCPCNSQSYY